MLDYNKLLPKVIRRIIAEEEIEFLELPYYQTIKCGVLFTDVTGFTKMTEIVSKGGHYSIEIITDLLNSYFDSMYNCIEDYEGDLIKFGGDSILAIFLGDKSSAEYRMKACLKDMRKKLKKLNIHFKKTYSLEIDFHENLSWGDVKINIVGDPIYHLDYFISGEALNKLFTQGDIQLDFEIDSDFNLKNEDNIKVDNKKLKQFFPTRINEWLENIKFRGELKKSSVVFLKVENEDESNPEIDLVNYHEFYKQLQRIVYFYEGTINKIDYNDKGYLILITFGVPYIHNDDIERAFVCSSKISKLPISGIKTKIGFTYNNIFSGILGAKNRYEYGIIGNGVNISARLMSESPYYDFTFSSEILPHIKGRYETEYIDRVKVKGIAKQIEIYHVTNELSDYWSALVSNYENDRIFGYEDELKEMDISLLTCIFGNSGSGKSHLIYEFLKPKVEQKQINTILVMSEYDQLKPFTIFYKIINRYLAIDNIVENIIQLEKFLMQQGLKLDLDIITDYFKEKSFEIKEKTTPIVYDILTEILVTVMKKNDFVIIENIQWLDQQSAQLLLNVIPKFQAEKKKLILTSDDSNLYADYDFYLPLKIKMKNFDETLARQFFLSKNQTITPKALKEILSLSQSNPAYIKEVSEIIEQNWAESKGIFDVSDFRHLVHTGKLPSSFETMLLNDFESLDDNTKQFLKYASIMGISFNNKILDIFSEEFVQENVRTVLERLTKDKYIFKRLILPEIEYYFNNSLMRDAIYKTILFKEKKHLHIIIAKYYIKNYHKDILTYYEVIANNFILARSIKDAIKWCLLAAKKNYELSAFGISNYYYTQALNFCIETKQINDIMLLLVAVNIAQNKIPEVDQYLKKIDTKLLTQNQLDLYCFYKIRLYEIQKNFKLFSDTYEEFKELIKSQEILFRTKLILFDYYRMSNSLDLFESIKQELNENIDSQSVMIGIIYYSILGQYYLDKSEYSLADENYQKLNKVALENDRKLYLRISTTSLGIIQTRQGNQEKALDYFYKALNIAEDIGDKHGYSKVNTEIAMIYFAQGLDEQALSTLNNCLNIAKYIGDKQQEQTVLYNFGYIHSVLQEYKIAIEYLTKARELAVIIDDKMGICYANDGLGDAYFQQKEFTLAKSIYENNIKLQKVLGDKEGIAHTIGNLANILREEKSYPKALEYYQIQYDSLLEIGDKIGQAKAFFNWGVTYEILGDNVKAIVKLTSAYKLFLETNDKNYSKFTKQQIDRITEKISISK